MFKSDIILISQRYERFLNWQWIYVNINMIYMKASFGENKIPAVRQGLY